MGYKNTPEAKAAIAAERQRQLLSVEEQAKRKEIVKDAVDKALKKVIGDAMVLFAQTKPRTPKQGKLKIGSYRKK